MIASLYALPCLALPAPRVHFMPDASLRTNAIIVQYKPVPQTQMLGVFSFTVSLGSFSSSVFLAPRMNRTSPCHANFLASLCLTGIVFAVGGSPLVSWVLLSRNLVVNRYLGEKLRLDTADRVVENHQTLLPLPLIELHSVEAYR